MERIGLVVLLCLILLTLVPGSAHALERPWISDVFFYWYTWDYERAWGGWQGGVYYTPLVGYYDSRTYDDNLRELWLSSEWGMTHHFMDYWSPDWKADTGEPRDLILMKAAQALADRGYDIWMSYYQDGKNFAMKDFARNVTEKRDVWNWLEHYAPFEAWPRLNGRPFQLVYARNGIPELTAEDEGFRAFLRERYGSIEGLARAWGEDLGSFDEIRVDFGATGPRRADAIDYQYHLWQQDWARLDEAVRAEFDYPGVAASFDVGYGPFRGFSYGDFARVFGGPHSYGGTFAKPDDQDARRFIQSIVAKKYGTVFFDHLKHAYCDWNTIGRIPGTEYPTEPCHFDRFWVGNLMRFDEAVLHLSWNEWWEGSNLEPSTELGKTYCEKNLLYSTIMQWCFPSLRDFGKDAKVALLLNDWAFKCGARDVSEIYFAIQEMRRTMVPFDLLVDDFVTAEELARFDLIVAPAAGIGFGYNAQRERIGDFLKRWIEGGSKRRLVVSASPEFSDYLGLKPIPAKPTAERGPDMNVWVDVGVEGDEQFLVGGCSGREDWGELAPDKFGASPTRHTVRWTPGGGRTTTLLLPASPNRDHVLRLSGNAIRPSTMSVRVGGEEAATIAVQEGRHDYQAAIPAAAVGGVRMLEIQLVYDRSIIPGRVDPERYGSESRTCNLALNWFQFSTANIGPSREQNYELPKRQVKFGGKRFGRLRQQAVDVTWRPIPMVAAPGGEVLSSYQPEGIPRDVLIRAKNGIRNQVWYINGRMDDVSQPRAFAAAAIHTIHGRVWVSGENVLGAHLRAGTTDIALVYNQDISTSARIGVHDQFLWDPSCPGQLPLAEVSILSRDGARGGTTSPFLTPSHAGVLGDDVAYYAVYQIVRAPVRIEHEPLSLAVGERRAVPITLENLTPEAVTGTIELTSVIPTLATDGEPVKFEVKRQSTVTVELPIRASETVDWGLKTVALKVTTEAGEAYFWRTLRVLPLPDLQIVEPIIDAERPSLTIENEPHPWSARAVAREVTLEMGNQIIVFGDIASGERRESVVIAPEGEGVTSHEAILSYEVGGKRIEEKRTVRFAHPAASVPGPANAVRAVQVFNPRETAMENERADVGLPSELRADAEHLYVADAAGRPVPAQIDRGRVLTLLASVPPQSARSYFLCRAEGDPPRAATDLVVEPRDLGTGRGTLRIANSVLEVELSEARGGTMTTLRSKASGADYAADSFGVAYGPWGKSDPLKPAHKATEYIVEKRTYQCDTPGTVRVTAAGPVYAVARVSWADAGVEVEQVYLFRAYGDGFVVSSRATPRAWHDGDELVVLDCRFARNGLSKIYPGFSGMSPVFEEAKPHFGWRQVPGVAECASLLAPPGFAETLSLVPVRMMGVDRWRQGFWPEKRPEPGPCKYAQVEFAATALPGRGVSAGAWVMLHAGNQVVVQQALADRQARPLVRLVEARPGTAGGGAADWWNPEWHFRAPLAVEAPAAAAVAAQVDLSEVPGSVDGDSFRLLRVGTTAVELVPILVDMAGKQATVQWRSAGAGQGRYHLYFDTLDHGKKRARPAPTGLLSRRFTNGALNKGTAGWVLAGARWLPGVGRGASGCLRFDVGPSQALAVASNGTMAATPNARYRVVFWARTVSGEGLLRTNFFAGPRHDFEQIEVRVSPDGQWHRFEVTVPTGGFPQGVTPVFRIWAINSEQTTYVDEVTMEPMSAAGRQPEARARVGPVERIAG